MISEIFWVFPLDAGWGFAATKSDHTIVYWSAVKVQFGGVKQACESLSLDPKNAVILAWLTGQTQKKKHKKEKGGNNIHQNNDPCNQE